MNYIVQVFLAFWNFSRVIYMLEAPVFNLTNNLTNSKRRILFPQILAVIYHQLFYSSWQIIMKKVIWNFNILLIHIFMISQNVELMHLSNYFLSTKVQE